MTDSKVRQASRIHRILYHQIFHHFLLCFSNVLVYDKMYEKCPLYKLVSAANVYKKLWTRKSRMHGFKPSLLWLESRRVLTKVHSVAPKRCLKSKDSALPSQNCKKYFCFTIINIRTLVFLKTLPWNFNLPHQKLKLLLSWVTLFRNSSFRTICYRTLIYSDDFNGLTDK